MTGILLCGGKSTRMGREKGMCMLFQRPLIEYSLEVLRPFCSRILLGTDNENYRYLGWPMIADEYCNIGPLGGIYSCLKASATKDNFVLSCDMPMVSNELINYVIIQKNDHEAVIPVFKGMPEPLCAYYSKQITGRLETFIQKKIYKIQEVFAAAKTRFVQVDEALDFYNEELFFNVNAPEDIEKLEQLTKNRRPK